MAYSRRTAHLLRQTMSDKKSQKSTSHDHRAVGYLKPCDHVFIEAYTKVHGVSKSSVVEIAVHQYIQSIPQEIRVQILKRSRNKF